MFWLERVYPSWCEQREALPTLGVLIKRSDLMSLRKEFMSTVISALKKTQPTRPEAAHKRQKRPNDELGPQQTICAAQAILAEAAVLRAHIGTRMSSIQDGVVALSDAECDALDQLHRQYKQKVAAAWSLVGDPTKSPGTGA
jgi:hypothetical protein